MRVAYLTTFRFDGEAGRYGRMHDLFDGFRTCDADFEWRVFPLIDEGGRLALSRLGYEADDLWGSRLHNVESLLSMPRVVRALRSYEPDIVHVPTARPVEGTIARTVASRLDAPVVCGPNVGGWFPLRPNELWEDSPGEIASNRLNYLANRLSVAAIDPDLLFAFSDYHREMLRSVRSSGPIEVLRPAVHPRFRPDPEIERETDLLYVGAPNERKGYPVFVDALTRLDGSHELQVDVVGGTPDDRPDFEAADVTYHGVVPREVLPRFYTRTKLFVCLSTDEMGPNTLVESFACGTPALVNDESSLTEYVRDGNGVRCDRTDADDVERRLRECLDDIDRLVENALDAAPSYDICRTVDQLEAVYRSVIDERS
mgnify:CR=1 FL=1